MSNFAAMFSIVAGVSIAIQVVLNQCLERHVSKILTVLICQIGSMIPALIVIVFQISTDKDFVFTGLRHAPWYTMIGGIFGFFTVFLVLFAMKNMSMASVVALVTCGQLAFSAALDHFGILGLEKAPLTANRILGIIILGLGTYLIKN